MRAMRNFTPDSIEQIGAAALRVRWQDGHESVYPARSLRQLCSCASCVDEISGERVLKPDAVPADLGMASAKIVGNYAIGFAFSDGHSSGIYTFEILRRSCPCQECVHPAPKEARA